MKNASWKSIQESTAWAQFVSFHSWGCNTESFQLCIAISSKSLFASVTLQNKSEVIALNSLTIYSVKKYTGKQNYL